MKSDDPLTGPHYLKGLFDKLKLCFRDLGFVRVKHLVEIVKIRESVVIVGVEKKSWITH